MRQFEVLDTGSFRAFYCAAETLNFTQAAKKAGLTQSGVSQHVARLEEQLGVSLFFRNTKRVSLTEAGKRLMNYVERYLDDVERLKEELSGEALKPEGPVAYAMPASCLLSPHFPMLLEARAKRFPGVDLTVTLCPSPDVVEKLLRAEVDFGFVTRHSGEADVHFEPFCEEEYILVGKEAAKGFDPARARWLDHPGADVLFEHWFRAKFPKKAPSPWSAREIVGGMNHLEGILTMAEMGLGVAIVPRHCAEPGMKRGTLKEISVGDKKPARNWIYIATPAKTRLPYRVQIVISTFLEMKGGPKPRPA
jgi:LysR family transcriptional regulator, transcriptional activator of the cysJI operon